MYCELLHRVTPPATPYDVEKTTMRERHLDCEEQLPGSPLLSIAALQLNPTYEVLQSTAMERTHALSRLSRRK